MSQYVDITFADNYFLSKLHTDAWDNATSEEKDQALMMMTSAIDNLQYIGSKAEESQDLEFPRQYDGVVETEVPDRIKMATCEGAISLLDGVDTNIEYENMHMTSQKYANVSSAYNGNVSEHIIYGIPSGTAWRYIKPFLEEKQTIDLARVS